MSKLVLSMDGLVLKEVVLSKERTTIGRKPHNDLVIDNLAVSGEHAVIVTILNDSFLEDLGSTNGTFVNGQPVKKHFLQNGDVIELGKYKLRFLGESAAPMAEFDQTLIVRDPPTVAKALPADLGQTASMLSLSSTTATTIDAALGGAASVKARVQVVGGPNAGRELHLTKALTTIGRPGVQVAVITRRPQGYFITHVEGAKYPIVNGQVIGADAHPLSDHDSIEISGTPMVFSLSTEA